MRPWKETEGKELRRPISLEAGMRTLRLVEHLVRFPLPVRLHVYIFLILRYVCELCVALTRVRDVI